MLSLLTTIFGDANAKRLKKYEKDLAEIKKIEAEYHETITTIDQVQAKTHEFQTRFAWLDIENEDDMDAIQTKLEETKHEAFALHRRACELIYGQKFDLGNGHEVTWNMIPYDVQLIGGLALHDKSIAEMRTGEGKTLVATLPAYLNSLVWVGVHIVTVNDYLARRDASEMGIIYRALGLSVGVITHGQNFDEKKTAYNSDIIYATNNELGFDYLRDNMAISAERRAMWKRWLAIVDEVDSILIDEARTPLIISAPDSEPTTKYPRFAAFARSLVSETDYKIDEKQKTATLTEAGIKAVEKYLWVDNIYVSQHFNDLHHVENALKSSAVYQKDVDYLVRNNEVMIIDEHTGRVLPGRRYSDGLHQAIEAKENVTIQQESRTLASITFQNYFRLYKKLAGMTGTAKTEEEEFFKIYRLEVVTIPTNMPIRRIDRGDVLFRSDKGKYEYLVRLIKALHEKWQPILVGTVSVAKSEYLSRKLSELGIAHEVLNAKQDSREAEIISKAGQYGSITIATNMAGRGTDIKIDDRVRTLEGVVKIEGAAWVQEYPLGWLYVIGTEKHETRRIDNQLRGRSGRQGDPGLSQFLLSPQDDIMRIFGGNKLFGILASFESHPEGDPLIESKMLMKNITTIQKQVEWRNFDIRKHILEYDDVLNHHRLAIYSRRNRILSGSDIHREVLEMIDAESHRLVDIHLPERTKEYDDRDYSELINAINDFAGENIMNPSLLEQDDSRDIVYTKTKTALLGKIEALRNTGTEDEFAEFERRLTLAAIDEIWMQHIDRMAHLREEVAFEWYAQKQPLIVYREKAYNYFIEMMGNIEHRVVKWLLTARPREWVESVNLEERLLESYTNTWITEKEVLSKEQVNVLLNSPLSPDVESATIYTLSADTKNPTDWFKGTERNAPCPCGSGKKYKQCHGKGA
jgi:preprotein translocase subunit SecA